MKKVVARPDRCLQAWEHLGHGCASIRPTEMMNAIVASAAVQRAVYHNDIA